MTDDTPLLDDLEKGPWPSYVKEIKRAASKNPAARRPPQDPGAVLQDRVTHWKHGGIVGVTGYGGGVIGRYCDSPDNFPNAAAFHTCASTSPQAGSTQRTPQEDLRHMGEVRKRHDQLPRLYRGHHPLGHHHGEPPALLRRAYRAGFDLGGSGSALRTPAGCIGQARCEYANIDTLDLIYDLTMTYQDEIHRPRWPYKFKIKASGCPNDCVAAIARADFTIIGTWRDSLRIDQKEVGPTSSTVST